MQTLEKRVLIIEDDQAIRDSLCELLESEGFVVSLAEHGLHGLETLEGLSVLPHVILLDLSMPVMDGHTFLERIQTTHSQFSKITILVMTAAGVGSFPKNHDPVKILRKPVDVDRLLDTIEKYLPQSK